MTFVHSMKLTFLGLTALGVQLVSPGCTSPEEKATPPKPPKEPAVREQFISEAVSDVDADGSLLDDEDLTSPLLAPVNQPAAPKTPTDALVAAQAAEEAPKKAPQKSSQKTAKTKSSHKKQTAERAPASTRSTPDPRELRATTSEPTASLLREAKTLLQSADARVEALSESATSAPRDQRALHYQASGYIMAYRERLDAEVIAASSDSETASEKSDLVEAMNQMRRVLDRFEDGVNEADFR